MAREHWHDPRRWLWWWRNEASIDSKGLIATAALIAAGIGGYAAAVGLGGEAGGSEIAVYETTIESVVTVEGRVRVVRTPVRLVRTVRVDGPRGEASTQVVTVPVVRSVPVVRREVVTRDGVESTVVRTITGVRTVRGAPGVVTRGRTVTNERVVTNDRVVTDERVVTTERVVTVEEVRTLARTVTQVETRVVTETVTVPVTVTQTIPSPTITVTSPAP